MFLSELLLLWRYFSLYPSILLHSLRWPPTQRRVSSEGFCRLHQSLCDDVVSGDRMWNMTKIYDLIWRKSGFIWQTNKRGRQWFNIWAAKWEPGMMEGLTSHDLVENSDCSDNGVKKKTHSTFIGFSLSKLKQIPSCPSRSDVIKCSDDFWTWSPFKRTSPLSYADIN